MRVWLLTVTVVLASNTLAQVATPGTPDAATCSQIVAPTRPLSPALKTTLLGTFTAYEGNLVRLLSSPKASTVDQQKVTATRREVEGYTTRLLQTIGWPYDPDVQRALEVTLNDPVHLWCAGQAALKVGTAPETAARMIDRALLNLTGVQRYGTVLFTVGRHLKPGDLEDPTGVDARRAGLGLPPLAQAVAAAEAALPPRPAPPGLSRPVVLREVCRPFTTERALNMPLTPERIDSLIDEAAAWVEQDQASRLGRSGARDMDAVDADTTAWLKAVLRESGWPSANRSDVTLASDAWLLAQHADRTPTVQACVLDLITQQRSTPQEAQNYAYLTDRVRIGSGRAQVYGTQVQYDSVQNRASPSRLEDPAGVDQRRAAVGLEPLADYLKRFEHRR
ncbi:DUF6624 domain-containing protein [Deinococcus daejeonensis]|uniref:Uncharacterized protein n=1 Tax=Deinococcus daejeonensis TaxID=1007098 RepID=A0ABQ2JCU3_9DEIO|nr:DUF6624 domain-containing protein [Deinococcus daejeonensis]GGN42703.1 hypothetical protein GCM10010842_29390 [Deinococcus daejeonensis]